MLIPIIIGVTGHRDLREKDILELRELVRVELQKLKINYPHSPLVMLNSLAVGADLLCAEEALKLNITLKCPIPMQLDEYRNDFNNDTLVRFDAIITIAKQVFVVPNNISEKTKKNRDYYYRQAGIYIAMHSHILLALWDGTPAKENGCGTAEVVDFMLGEEYDGHIKAINEGIVIHINTPRKSSNSELKITTRLIENRNNALSDSLQMIDDFNKYTRL
ncbi:MAG: hypothetical protein VB009_01450 [Erysipelotrichaceae bacterium]|nr:hypothetical protein [Erysipelotrichaceae bacterium]